MTKGGEHNQLEHTETQEEREYSLTDEKNELKQAQTLSQIDVENHAAVKGDDSDGAVDWTFRNIMASIFLCTLYTGTRAFRCKGCLGHLLLRRLSNHSLFRWWVVDLHHRGLGLSIHSGLVTRGQHSGYRCGRSLHGLSPGSLWKTLHRSIWSSVDLRRHHRSRDCSWLRSRGHRNGSSWRRRRYRRAHWLGRHLRDCACEAPRL